MKFSHRGTERCEILFCEPSRVPDLTTVRRTHFLLTPHHIKAHVRTEDHQSHHKDVRRFQPPAIAFHPAGIVVLRADSAVVFHGRLYAAVLHSARANALCP